PLSKIRKRRRGYRGLFRPMAVRIERIAVHVAASHVASPLVPLFGAVVMRLAQRLPVGLIPEQAHILAMRLDVVDDSRADSLSIVREAHAAPRMLGEIRCSRFVPSRGIATL